MQKDLHLGNFLLDGERILTLDPAQIQFFPQAVTRTMSVSQLALLARYLPADDAESASRLCREYFVTRQWDIEKADEIASDAMLSMDTVEMAKAIELRPYDWTLREQHAMAWAMQPNPPEEPFLDSDNLIR